MTSLAQRYVEINRDLALLNAKHRGGQDEAQTARLLLRAAALQAMAHNDRAEVAQSMLAFIAEIEE